jgi:hypothetical protein
MSIKYKTKRGIKCTLKIDLNRGAELLSILILRGNEIIKVEV